MKKRPCTAICMLVAWQLYRQSLFLVFHSVFMAESFCLVSSSRMELLLNLFYHKELHGRRFCGLCNSTFTSSSSSWRRLKQEYSLRLFYVIPYDASWVLLRLWRWCFVLRNQDCLGAAVWNIDTERLLFVGDFRKVQDYLV